LLPIVDRAIFGTGRFQLVGCTPAWYGNQTWDQFIAYGWDAEQTSPVLVAVNYGSSWAQCFVRPFQDDLPNHSFRFRDLLSAAVYDRDGTDLAARGLYLDLPPWGYHVFEIETLKG